MALAKILFWLALGTWVGAIVFFSFVVAPGVFATLPSESAGQVVGAIFPRYYVFGIVAEGIAAAAAAFLWQAASRSRAWAAVTLMVGLMLGTTLYAARVVHPQAQALRPMLHQPTVEPGVRADFDRLHHAAVRLNAAVLVLGVVSMCVAAVSRDSPRP